MKEVSIIILGLHGGLGLKEVSIKFLGLHGGMGVERSKYYIFLGLHRGLGVERSKYYIPWFAWMSWVRYCFLITF